MSYFSQFVGSQVPVGGIIQLPGLFQINPTISGAEYLASGYVKAYSSTYASLAAVLPAATNQLPTTTGVWGLTTTYTQLSSNGLRLEKGGSYFYAFGCFNTGGSYPGYYYSYGSSITASPVTSGYGNGAILDSGTFNGNAIYTEGLGIGSGNSAVSSGALQNRYTDSVSGNMLAVGSTVAVAVRNGEAVNAATSGFVKTTTNGTTWTDRTISISGSTTSGTIARATWSTIGNCFIYVTSDGLIYTSPDGYTLTQRTTPSGTPAVNSSSYGQSSMCGNSPTATLISIGGRNSLGGPYVLKTTNGTTFTLIDLSTVSGLFAAYSGTYPYLAYVPNIAYDTTTSKLVISVTAGTYYTSLPNTVAYSTNDGASWTIDSVKFVPSGINKVFGMGMCDGNFYMGIGTGDANNSASMGPTFFNNKIGNTPDYVGYSTAATTGSFSGFLRIA